MKRNRLGLVLTLILLTTAMLGGQLTTDLLGQSLWRQIVNAKRKFTVYPKLVITTADPLTAVVIGNPYSVQFAATGGKPPYTWKVTLCNKIAPDGVTTAPCPAPLPAGLTFTTAGLLSGTVTESGDFQLTVEAQDSAP
jgi:hypothetical protein